MNPKCVVAVFETIAKANVALEVLSKAGFGNDQISFISRHDSPDLDELQHLQAKGQMPTDTEVSDRHRASSVAPGTALGATIGSIVAAPVAVGSLVFPLFVVGPILGAGLGAVLGGLFDSDKNSDHEKESTYAEHVTNGACLIVVTGDKYQLREAKASLKTCGPIELDEYQATDEAAST